MRKDIPKFTVTIITYNQEDVIGRAIDSILCQKEWIYEIVICDDCSTDNNWKVILDYQSKYPDIIKPFRNEVNLGIYGNIERTWKESTGEMIIELSGDDTIEQGIFEEAYNLIKEKNIDYKNKPISLHCDFQIKYPNGFARKGQSNKMLLNKKYDPVSLKLRGFVSTRTTLYSRPLLEKFQSVPKNLGHFCDELIDIQKFLYSEEQYYFNFIGSTYYAHIGVSVNHKIDAYLDSMDKTKDYIFNEFNLSQKERNYYEFLHHKRWFIYKDHSLKRLYSTFKYYLKSIELKYGFKSFYLQRFIFDIRLFAKSLMSK